MTVGYGLVSEAHARVGYQMSACWYILLRVLSDGLWNKMTGVRPFPGGSRWLRPRWSVQG